jgi:nucleoid-associated protein YgaU
VDKVAGTAEPPAASEEAPPPQIGIAAVEAETTGTLYVAGTTNRPGPVRVYLNDELVGEAAPGESGNWLLQAKRDLPAGEYRVRADGIDKATGDVVVRAEVPFEREVEVAVLKPVGETGAAPGTETSGSMPPLQTVIIKRGDNLWRLSRSWYGKGVRWSTLYAANKDQIRNPRWIYPGQVFMVPAGDATWKN